MRHFFEKQGTMSECKQAVQEKKLHAKAKTIQTVERKRKKKQIDMGRNTQQRMQKKMPMGGMVSEEEEEENKKLGMDNISEGMATTLRVYAGRE
jgi:hypothetical protein